MKMSKNIALAAGVVLALIAVNALVFTGYFEKSPAYKGVPLLGKNALENLGKMREMKNATIIFEGDAGTSQKNGLLGQAAVELSSFLGKTGGVEIYGIEFENGTALRCLGGRVLEECMNYLPPDGSFLVRIKYPTYGKNEVAVTENTIELRARDASEALALAYWLEDVMKAV